jgi:hypothetical protein
MFDKNRKWDILCCRSLKGACRTCGSGAAGFANIGNLGWDEKNRKNSKYYLKEKISRP